MIRRGLVVVFAALFFASCAKELAVEPAQKREIEAVDPGAIALEDALSEMYDLMNHLYSSDTRAANRQIANIHTFETPLHITRSTGHEPQTLAYIVNFDQGDYLVGSTGDDFIKRQLLVTVMASGWGGNDPGDTILPPGGGNEPGTLTSFGPWSNGTPVGPLLESKGWHQDSPFNDNCPKGADAGCVPIALTQILAYNEKPAITSICPNVTSTWDDLKSWRDGSSDARINRDMALVIHAVGQGVNAWYNIWFSNGGTFAFPAAAKKYMKRNGYPNVKKRTGYQRDVIYNMVVGKRKPVFIAAMASFPNAHAWVIDGHMTQSRPFSTYNGNNQLIHSGTDTRSLVHCNFGWRDSGDNGYYVSELFDTGDGPVIPDPAIGSGRSDNFTHWYRIIEY